MPLHTFVRRLRAQALASGVATALVLSLAGTPGPAHAQTAPAPSTPQLVSPAAAGPGSTFTFTATGFRGDPKDNDDDTTNDAERVAFWINTPDGGVIRAVQSNADASSSRDATAVRAGRDGVVSWRWTAPSDAVPGAYTLVAYGLASERAVVIPFQINAGVRGILAGATGQVTPEAGPVGTRFTFVIGGFRGDPKDGDDDTANNAEEVVFWLNAPGGEVVKVVRAGADEDARDASRVRAERSGQVTLTWVAPASLQPGTYTLVAHGLQSEREAVVQVTIR